MRALRAAYNRCSWCGKPNKLCRRFYYYEKTITAKSLHDIPIVALKSYPEDSVGNKYTDLYTGNELDLNNSAKDSKSFVTVNKATAVKRSGETGENVKSYDISRMKTKKEKMFFEENFQNSIQIFCNYMQACLFSSHLTQSLNMLEARIKSTKQDSCSAVFSKIATEPLVYDLILSRLAAISPTTSITCNFVENSSNPFGIIRQIFKEMKELNLRPSPSAYGSALEAMDKLPNQNVGIALCLQEIQENGYTFDEVLRTRCRGSKSAKHVHHAIMQVADYNQYRPQISSSSAYTENLQNLPVVARDLYTSKKYNPGALQLSSFSKVRALYQAQLVMEKSRNFRVKNVLSSELSSGKQQAAKRRLAEHLTYWRESLLKTFQDLKKREKSLYNRQEHFNVSGGGKLYPFLCLLPEQEYIEIIINHLCSTVYGGDFTSVICSKLGEEVYARFAIHRMRDGGILNSLNKVYPNYGSLYTDKQLQATMSPRHLWLDLEEKHGLTYLEDNVLPWNQYWTFAVGMKLIEMMHTLFFIPQNNEKTSGEVPAVYTSYVYQERKQHGMIIPHPQFRLLLQEAVDELMFEVEDAPMVIPPRPWCGIKRGGLLINQVPFMRHNAIDEDFDPERVLKDDDLIPIYDSLNILGSVAWKINKPILDLQLKYYRNNGSKELDIPQPAIMSEPIPDLSRIDPEDVASYNLARKKAVAVQKERKEMHSLYMEALYKFSIANEYRDSIIWFPHNIDFRGRFYPVPRHFNYMGSDVYRSQFLFAEGQPLGEKGLDWLKLHCINLTDFKKHSSIADRLAYANEVMDLIIASADSPESEDSWWKSSDKPWQTLAACMEIAAAVRSSDPTKFVSRLPIHQDGSCNGLQHYAALGRDLLGAQQVNLSPSVIPQDVYSGVGEKAEELRKNDAKKGVEIAKTLEGFIRRKVVKQTVMTTVYGVTRYGGMSQIYRQLKDLEDEFPRTECGKGANYLVDKVFASITEMFAGAKNIQEWFTQLADVVSKMGHPVDWTTPLNLTVTQPYYKQDKKYISSPVQRMTVAESIKAVPNRSKQVNGFPPNFIHSLDSTHMMLTALNCYRSGIMFASVHDCFWTHASTVDVMGRICREQFVSLHSQPILENLALHLHKYLPHRVKAEDLTPLQAKLHYLLNNVPKRGEFDLSEVMDSTFFFS